MLKVIPSAENSLGFACSCEESYYINLFYKVYSVITVSNLSKQYGQYKAVSNVSFSAEKGEVVGFLGPNGAGKTTTIRMLSTFLPPTSGTASIAGFDILTQADEVRKHIGYLPENPPLYDDMTVQEYLKFIGAIKGMTKGEINRSMGDVIEKCSLSSVTKTLCQHLSRGYRQRVGLAQAIIHNPQVVILDEPTSGLDPKQITEIRQTISNLKADKTVILSTHILPEVSMICSKVVIVNHGRVVVEKQLSEIEREGSLEHAFLSAINQERPAHEASY